MTLIRTNRDMFPSFSSLFDDFFNTEIGDWRRNNYSESNTSLPKVNILEYDDKFELEMAAPGMGKPDFNLRLDHNTLTISAQRDAANAEPQKRYTKREFAYHTFQRSFTLPESADTEKISASYADGILTVGIPKREEAKPKAPKTINIG